MTIEIPLLPFKFRIGNEIPENISATTEINLWIFNPEGVDNLSEASYYFASPNPDAQKLRNQGFGETLSHSEGRTVFASDPVSNFPDRRGEGPTGVSPRLVLQF